VTICLATVRAHHFGPESEGGRHTLARESRMYAMRLVQDAGDRRAQIEAAPARAASPRQCAASVIRGSRRERSYVCAYTMTAASRVE